MSIYIYTNINIEDVHIYIGGKSKLSSQNAIQNPQLQISFAFGTNLWFILWPFPREIDCRSSFCQPVHVRRPWRIPSEAEGLWEQTVCLWNWHLCDQNRLRTLEDRTQSVEGGAGKYSDGVNCLKLWWSKIIWWFGPWYVNSSVQEVIIWGN